LPAVGTITAGMAGAGAVASRQVVFASAVEDSRRFDR